MKGRRDSKKAKKAATEKLIGPKSARVAARQHDDDKPSGLERFLDRQGEVAEKSNIIENDDGI